MSRINRGKTSLYQLNYMRNKYLKDSEDKMKGFNDRISILEAEVGPYVDKVRELEHYYICLRKEQRRYNRLRNLLS